MAREAVLKRVEARRAAKSPVAKTRRLTTRDLENLVIAALVIATVAAAAYWTAYDGLVRQYERALESTVRIVATNVENCIRSGRVLEPTRVAPFCRDPSSGAAAPTDLVSGFPMKPALQPASPLPGRKTPTASRPTLPALVAVLAAPRQLPLLSARRPPGRLRISAPQG